MYIPVLSHVCACTHCDNITWPISFSSTSPFPPGTTFLRTDGYQIWESCIMEARAPSWDRDAISCHCHRKKPSLSFPLFWSVSESLLMASMLHGLIQVSFSPPAVKLIPRDWVNIGGHLLCPGAVLRSPGGWRQIPCSELTGS